MPRPIDDMVVVITGASSGIGKATALAFAQRGARLVLGARREQLLEETALSCVMAGTHALSVPTDVSDEAQVRALAARALEAFGRIDVWINNAGIDAFGGFEDTPTAAFERVIQVNLLGTANGARAVLPHFREHRSGVLINNASIVGVCPSPFHSAYVASKFAIRGLSHSLRQEFLGFPGIHICTILPSSIDTPLWQHAANYSGRKVKPLDPIHPPEQVAAVMVDLVQAPQREVFAGATGWMLAEQHAAEPQLTEVLVAGFARESLFQDEPAAPSAGVLFEPGGDPGRISGGWRSANRPGMRSCDLLVMMAAPGLLATAPLLYSWKLSFNFFLQLARQFGTIGCEASSPLLDHSSRDRDLGASPVTSEDD
jgi:NAD(P)-dependent dehydrogenase (short-subunit alcohol dehydrogenase family)